MTLTIPDKLLSIAAVASAPVLTTLVDTHTLSANLATDIGAIVAAVLAGWHGKAITASRTNPTENKPAPTTQV